MAVQKNFTMKVLALAVGAALLVGGAMFTIGAKTIKAGAGSEQAMEFDTLEDIGLLALQDNYTMSSRITMVRNHGKGDKYRINSNNTYYVTEDAMYVVYDYTMRHIDEKNKTTASIKVREYVEGGQTYFYLDRFSYTYKGKSYSDADSLTGKWFDLTTGGGAEDFIYTFIDDYTSDFLSIFFEYCSKTDKFQLKNKLFTLYDDEAKLALKDAMRVPLNSASSDSLADKPTAKFEADLYHPASPTLYFEAKNKVKNNKSSDNTSATLNFSAKVDVAFKNVANTKISVPEKLKTSDGETFERQIDSIIAEIKEDRK